MDIDFIFDVASPNAYLSHKAVPHFEKKHNVTFNYIPCLLGGIFKITNNTAPMVANAEIPKKLDYMFREMKRFSERHKITSLKHNPFFPINTVTLQRASLFAQENGIYKKYVDVVLKGMWEDEINMGDQEILRDYLNANDLDGDALIEAAGEQRIKDLLFSNTQNAVDRGAFGVPTFFIDDELFFGKEAFNEMPDYL